MRGLGIEEGAIFVGVEAVVAVAADIYSFIFVKKCFLRGVMDILDLCQESGHLNNEKIRSENNGPFLTLL